MEKLPIYHAKLNENSDIEYKVQGVQNIALVDSPAMMTEWLMFNEQKPIEFKMAIQEEKRIITAPVIIADLPIYRRIENEEFYVVYDKQTIMQVAQKYGAENRNKQIKLTHDTEQLSKGIYVFESFVSDKDRGIKQPDGFDLPDGTWFVSMKIENDEIWNKAKKGEVKGISLEGYFDLEPDVELTDSEIQAIIHNIIS